MDNYEDLTREELISYISNLKNDISSLEDNSIEQEKEIDRISDDLTHTEEELDEVELEFKDYKELFEGNLNSQMKTDYLMEAWDRITLDDLEQIAAKK